MIFENSSFIGNHGFHGDCSALLVKGVALTINNVIFGSCLSKCVSDSNADIAINKSDPDNFFWNLVSTTNTQSPSTFVEHPKSVVFCTPALELGDEDVHCANTYEVSAYRGQIFTVPLMVTDGFCYPSVEIIEAKVHQESESGLLRESTLQLERGFLQKARKSCHNFSYAVRGGFGYIFKLQQQLIPPVHLTLHLKDCPKAYELNSEVQCDCFNILKSYNIECNSSHYSLTIPAQTWVGEMRDGSIVMHKDCQYCSNEEAILTSIVQDSNELCSTNRHGIMCGACDHNYSLQLGGYECANCSNSAHKGVLLLIAFAIS